MMTISQLTALFGWTAVINMGYLFLSTMTLIFMKETVTAWHSKMFNMGEKELSSKYFDFVSNYKIATLVFSVVPYIALKIIAS